MRTDAAQSRTNRSGRTLSASARAYSLRVAEAASGLDRPCSMLYGDARQAVSICAVRPSGSTMTGGWRINL